MPIIVTMSPREATKQATKQERRQLRSLRKLRRFGYSLGRALSMPDEEKRLVLRAASLRHRVEKASTKVKNIRLNAEAQTRAANRRNEKAWTRLPIKITCVYAEPDREPVDLRAAKIFWGAPKA